jgi:hypothetical protein
MGEASRGGDLYGREHNESCRFCVYRVSVIPSRFVHLGAVAVEFGAASSKSVVPREGLF